MKNFLKLALKAALILATVALAHTLYTLPEALTNTFNSIYLNQP